MQNFSCTIHISKFHINENLTHFSRYVHSSYLNFEYYRFKMNAYIMEDPMSLKNENTSKKSNRKRENSHSL